MLSNTTTTGPDTQSANIIFDAIWERSLDFRIQLSYEQALPFIERIEAYNEFQSHAVLDALERVDRVIPRCSFNEGNPNNGKRDYKIAVGREGSPVIYIERYEFLTRRPMTDDEMKAVCREMELCGVADESTYEVHDFSGSYGRRITFRFWWD